MPKFMITVRSTSGASFTGALGRIRYLVVPDDAAEPTTAHTTTRSDWVGQVMATFPSGAGGNATGDLLFFVHGFDNGIAAVAARHGEIAKGLAGKLACTIVSFDWPSAGEPYAYLPDLDVAKLTAVDLVNAGVRPLIAAQTDDCRVAVHALCHSMGAYVAREALDHADDGTVTGSDWSLNQLVLVAGDVEAADFVDGNKDTESMLGHSYRLTNYFSKYDEVLQISNVKRVGVEPRVGRVGLPPNAPAKTVNVDCSARFEKARPADMNVVDAATFSHGWYFSDPNFFTDLAQTLSGAVDRAVVPGRILAADGRSFTLAV
jgi:esterase/lipase superfamily enzyme